VQKIILESQAKVKVFKILRKLKSSHGWSYPKKVISEIILNFEAGNIFLGNETCIVLKRKSYNNYSTDILSNIQDDAKF